MNKNETIKIMQVLKTKYPKYLQTFSREEKVKLLDTWKTEFSEVPYDTVLQALNKHRNKYFPLPSEVKGYISEMRYEQEEESDPEFVEVYREAIMQFQEEWRKTGVLPSTKTLEKVRKRFNK